MAPAKKMHQLYSYHYDAEIFFWKSFPYTTISKVICWSLNDTSPSWGVVDQSIQVVVGPITTDQFVKIDCVKEIIGKIPSVGPINAGVLVITESRRRAE